MYVSNEKCKNSLDIKTDKFFFSIIKTFFVLMLQIEQQNVTEFVQDNHFLLLKKIVSNVTIFKKQKSFKFFILI